MKIQKTQLILLFLTLGTITYAQKAKKDTIESIQEVTLIKRAFVKKNDRYVFDVAQSPLAKGNNGFDLLKSSPMVSSIDNKNLTILGKSNAVIYINGKKSQLNGESLLELLKNTPGENISKIEIITVPGSEFNVGANDGIINVVMKKRTSDGINGTLRMTNNQGYYNNPSSSVSVNYRKNKLGINVNTNYSQYTLRQAFVFSNGNQQNFTTSEGYIMVPTKSFGGNFDVNYDLNDHHFLSLSFDSREGNRNGQITDLVNNEYSFNGSGFNLNRNRTLSNTDETSASNSANLNYEWKTDDNGSNFNANIAYLHYTNKNHAYNNIYSINDQNENITRIKAFNQSIPQIIDNFSGTLDYAKKFKDELSLSVGGNFNSTKTDNDTRFTDFVSGNFVENQQQSNHFIYNEKITGLYATLAKTFNEKFSGKIGSRIEFTNATGDVVNKNESFTNNYSNILPYLNFNYEINKDHNISYTFSSRVSRPSFWAINPTRIYLTQNNYAQNNPFIKASSYYSQELNYMYKSAYFLTLDYMYVKDAQGQVPLQRTLPDGTVQIRYLGTNYGDHTQLTATVGLQKQFFKNIWNVNGYFNFYYVTYKGNVDTDPTTGDVFSPYILDLKKTYAFFQINNSIRLSSKKDWFVDVNYFYQTRRQIEYGKQIKLSSLDIGIKKIWDDWTVMIKASDIFRNFIFAIDNLQTNTGSFNNVYQNQYNRQVTLTVTYNFGNQKVKRIRDVESADNSIKSRTK
ncbi:Outer membrane receptor proteins, mostly Fe transport [Chryseobacterium taeanense]|uniref:Outer membrane receptor proteins, mostly Fe transport n=1 Tax=Chryseobacterium taeanense TaxID=311334 RepID=A0A1G8J247_9FLAO|nr:TonB-dependent receptor [Chryseobacterium taeanense]SDI25266.1 Outer membrane receptor proteins, mostly Fe transport [Chryseobacterium taeanense]